MVTYSSKVDKVVKKVAVGIYRCEGGDGWGVGGEGDL